jgi:hypothetical protein
MLDFLLSQVSSLDHTRFLSEVCWLFFSGTKVELKRSLSIIEQLKSAPATG